MQAIVDLRDNSTVNVNLLTHLAKERIKRLIANGSSFSDANKQAQKELLTNFGLQKYAEKDVAQFSITAGTDEAAALLVVSAAMINTRSEAELTEYLGKLSLDFTTNGKFTDEQKAEYRKTATGLNFSRIADNVKERYERLGKDVSVKTWRTMWIMTETELPVMNWGIRMFLWNWHLSRLNWKSRNKEERTKLRFVPMSRIHLHFWMMSILDRGNLHQSLKLLLSFTKNN